MTTGIQLNVTMLNVDAVSQLLRDMAGPKARGAYAKALNDAGFHVRKTMQDEMRSKFDRVTPYMERSPFVRRATADKLEVSIEPTYMGGKGVDPQKILQAQSFGGRRRDKRSEAAPSVPHTASLFDPVPQPTRPAPAPADAAVEGHAVVEALEVDDGDAFHAVISCWGSDGLPLCHRKRHRVSLWLCKQGKQMETDVLDEIAAWLDGLDAAAASAVAAGTAASVRPVTSFIAASPPSRAAR